MELLDKLPQHLSNKILRLHSKNIDNLYNELFDILTSINRHMNHCYNSNKNAGGYLHSYLITIPKYVEFFKKFSNFLELQSNKKELYEKQVKDIFDIDTEFIKSFYQKFRPTISCDCTSIACLENASWYIVYGDDEQYSLFSSGYKIIQDLLEVFNEYLIYLLEEDESVIRTFIKKNKRDKMSYLLKEVMEKTISELEYIEDIEYDSIVISIESLLSDSETDSETESDIDTDTDEDH